MGKSRRHAAGPSTPALALQPDSKTGRILMVMECPMCGTVMRLSVREVQSSAGAVQVVREWICPECDYFEEAETAKG